MYLLIKEVLLDFAKAFDTVSHRRLIAKLKAYGFDGLVIKWIEAFRLGRIKKSFTRFDSILLRTLYLTFICTLLEFAVPVWSTILKSDCEVIERVQHKATKLVSSFKNLNYNKRLEALDLTILMERRQRGDLIQM